MDQLKSEKHHARPGLPNPERMRKWIEHCSLQRSSDTDYRQSIIDGLMSACAEEGRLSYRAQEPVGSAVDLLGSGATLLEPDFHQKLEIFQKYFISCLHDGGLTRVYFRTRTTLGTGYSSVRPGDEIWFLHGASAPIILRPLATGNYRFTGEAYVHGVMYGEAGAESGTHELITIV